MYVQGSHFLESPGMSWNRAKCPAKSWNLMNFRKFGFIGIWNDDCCSISLKFEIPSTFLCKISRKLLKIVLESPANDSRHLSGNSDVVHVCMTSQGSSRAAPGCTYFNISFPFRYKTGLALNTQHFLAYASI